VVLLSQTCDLVQANKESVQVAPIVRLPQTVVSNAAKGAMPGYVYVPFVASDAFADLDRMATVSKSHIAQLTPEPGAPERQFGMRVGRRFSRFPFPDEVTWWLEPLKKAAIGKSGNSNSALGRVLDDWVESLRLECDPSWHEGPPFQVTLLVLVRPNALPVLDEDNVPEPSTELHGRLYNSAGDVRQTPATIADWLLSGSYAKSRSDTWWLWDAFGQSLAAVCKPKASAPKEIFSAVVDGRFDSEVATVREVTYERILRSEEIDLEHLSDPLPR
jgi:hypothetical protein